MLVKIEQHAKDMVEEQASLAVEKAEMKEKIESIKAKSK